MNPPQKALAFIENELDGDFAICAHDLSGKLLGVAGFKTYDGALVGGTFRSMVTTYGTFGAIWRTALLSLLERDVENTRFLMDGIFVTENARGQGVGSALLKSIITEATRRGYCEVRLDVVDTNPRARELYARSGFEVFGTQNIGLLRHVFGFNAATTMIYKI